MRIAYILPSLRNTGPGIVVKELCIGLKRLGHYCEVFYFDEVEDPLELDCLTHRIKLFRKINFNDWDIVHSHMLRPDIWVALHKPLLKKTRTKFITTIHQNIRETLSSDYGTIIGISFNKIWNIALSRFDKIVVLTTAHIASIDGSLKPKIDVVYNGVNINQDYKIDPLDIDKIEEFKEKYSIILGSNSLMTKRKGLEQIIKSLQYLPQCGYIGVGDGPCRTELEKLSIDLGVHEQCLWIGYKKCGYRYCAVFDIYMIPSRSEGFPLSLIEAAALQSTVVCSDIEIFRSILDEELVVFSTLDNIEELSNKIVQAYRDKSSLSSNLFNFYNKNLTQHKMCSNYAALYNKISK